jgi:hypothetical protein
VATDLGFHHHTTHEHTHDGEDELLFVFQPFENSNQNKNLVIECMESIAERLSNVSVSLRETGDTNRPDDPISIQYLIIVEEVSDSDDATVNVPEWLSRSIESSS